MSRDSSFDPPDGFCFLNAARRVAEPSDWNHPGWEKLWLYNLHYFDDLNAADAGRKRDAHAALIRRWIAENPAPKGNGWEPYPLSLRIVNWIKWLLAGNAPPDGMIHSLAVQTRILRGRLEYHLLGNHLFANAKALCFSGLFFKGADADGWLEKGWTMVERELAEQILPDGGHFERSPMYHAIILEDLLDLINMAEAFRPEMAHGRRAAVAEWREKAGAMARWLGAMRHPDGEIVLFNDAAFRIAPAPERINAYGRRLSAAVVGNSDDAVTHFTDSGYVRIQKGPAVAFLDVAPVGPDYLPGHAHADTLTFELSLFGRRVIVDTGTSVYGDGPERLRQRSTAAHNTVVIDGENSSEVWGGFRVARRARPLDLDVREDAEEIRIACAHDGYRWLPGRPTHHRRWRLSDRAMSITDTVSGNFKGATARFHFHPDIALERHGDKSGLMRLPDGRRLPWRVEGGREVSILATTFHPEFGLSMPNHCLEIRFSDQQIRTEFGFQPCTSSS